MTTLENIPKTYVLREIEGKTKDHVLIAQRKNTELEVIPIFHEDLRTISREVQKVKLIFKQVKRGRFESVMYFVSLLIINLYYESRVSSYE